MDCKNLFFSRSGFLFSIHFFLPPTIANPYTQTHIIIFSLRLEQEEKKKEGYNNEFTREL